MQENIYAAPEASLEGSETASMKQAFYIVSVPKFLVLYFLTFGLYGMYWHYKNWAQYKIAYNDDQPMPIMRAIFSIFFTHSLFSIVDMRIKDQGAEFSWNPNLWATVAVIALLVGRIIDRVFADGTFSNPLEYISLVSMVVYGFALYKAQRAINIACNDPDGASNRNITLVNCIWIFLGTLLLSLFVIGIFLPDTELE